jgi:hypothetical protein
MKPVIAGLWILSLALAVGLARRMDSDQAASEASPSFTEVFSEFDALQRTYLLSNALRALNPDNLPELKRVLMNKNMGIQTEEVRLLMLAWARFDAPGAFKWASEEGPKNWRGTLRNQAIYAWGYHDGLKAISVAEEAEDVEVMERLKQNALDGWLRSEDKTGVSNYIAVYPDLKRRGRLFFLLAGEIVMTKGHEPAMTWVEEIPDDTPNQLKMAIFIHVAKMVASEDPKRAGEWFLANREHPYSEGGLSGVALRWVQHHDRPAAFEFLLSIDKKDLREGELDEAIAQAFRTWMQLDPEGAQEWLGPMLPNPRLDRAVEEATRRLLPTDPAASMAWAERLDDAEDRHRHVSRVGIRWRRKDMEAFNAWLDESDVAEETLEKIMAAPIPEKRRSLDKIKPRPANAGKP